MKYIISGGISLLCGVVLYGLRMVSSAILVDSNQFKDIKVGYSIIGSFPRILIYFFILAGILLIVIGLRRDD